MHQVVSVLILLPNLHKDVLRHNHDAPVAGYFGKVKTLECLCCDRYWINIPKDVDDYCGRCSICQQSKLSMCAPLQSIPIEQPWQIIAVDILKVPLSTNNNYYLLMIQSLSRNTAELIQFFCTYGPPQMLHSDQGCNFKSAILTQVWMHLVFRNHIATTPYHPQGDAWQNDLIEHYIVQLLRTYV